MNRGADPSVAAIPDEALVEAALDGADWACRALYDRHANVAFTLAARLMGERDAAADAMQNAFIAAFGKLHRLRDRCRFSQWLRTIVVRECQMSHRQRRRHHAREHIVNVDALAAPEGSTAEMRGAFAQLHRWMETVREPDRSIYLLKVVEGHSNEQIADIVEVSLATVKRKVSRVEAHLRSLRDKGAT